MINAKIAVYDLKMDIKLARRSYFRNLGTFIYLNTTTKLFFAFCTAQLVVLYQEKHTLIQILKNPFYYLALGVSLIIAYAVIEWVVWVTRVLDYQYPWARNSSRRWPRQVFYSILLPLLFTILLVTVYFAALKINILQTRYFSRHLQQLIWMLIALNAYLYFLINAKKSAPNKTKQLLQQSVKVVPEMQETIHYACFFAENKSCFVYTFSKAKSGWDDTLSETILYLDPKQYYMVNRSIIVNRLAIATVITLAPKKIMITLIAPLAMEILVSQRAYAGFKKWYELG